MWLPAWMNWHCASGSQWKERTPRKTVIQSPWQQESKSWSLMSRILSQGAGQGKERPQHAGPIRDVSTGCSLARWLWRIFPKYSPWLHSWLYILKQTPFMTIHLETEGPKSPEYPNWQSWKKESSSSQESRSLSLLVRASFLVTAKKPQLIFSIAKQSAVRRSGICAIIWINFWVSPNS